MLLSADRLDVLAGERIHAVLIVTTPLTVVHALGGVDRLRRQLADIGFQQARVFLARPTEWQSSPDVPRPGDLEWLLYAELVAPRAASFRRELSEELRIADAWDARLDGGGALPNFHPYAVHECASARLAGTLRAFATAYPIEVS